eukprot:CAMPEP_0169127144 /NCGR_PEP_ID=MMETSP1015-20121227/35843_1 /TAXON_ID=342587 /ORGANISM="Karlodinium micrum, Strain CCMP2283" /LENGTH=230 /DNA_ID=CAMNT_0009190891 /DNA_START=43 /DNA_END=735 /DNA_ORIENTATION=-
MAEKPAALDGAIVRGVSTKVAIGTLYKLALSKATTFAIVDRKSYKQAEPAVHKLRKAVYDDGEEEQPDCDLRDRALAYFTKAETVQPSCALLHFADDKMLASSKLPDPLAQQDLVLSYQRENHIQTIKVFHLMSSYAKMAHALKATTFVVCPHNATHWSPDVAQSNVNIQRIVQSNRMMNNSMDRGWLLGLQLLDDSSDNCEKIHEAVKVLHGLPGQKKTKLSGQVLPLK